MTITEINVRSPYDDDCIATFNCHFNSAPTDEVYDVVKLIRFLSYDLPQLDALLASHPDAIKSNENMKHLLDDYCKWIEANKQMLLECQASTEYKQASNELIKYLMLVIYNRAVLDPDKLNHYEPFSPQVYGETSYDLIDQLLKRVPLNENDVFMDLGSGVGNVVLHVAAMVKCKHCYGFEKAEWPAHYAARMEKEFKFWMKFFNKSYSNFSLYKGDFLSDEEFVDEQKTKSMNDYVKEIINEANLIFVNNYAFGAEVDHQLKLRFCNMLEGAYIVSSKPFCSLHFRITSRNLNDIGAILKIDFDPLNGHVSWTDKPINYYFHKIDRTLLEKYFESKKNNSSNSLHDSSDTKKHSKSQSPSSVSSTSSTSMSPSQSPPSSPSSSSSSYRSRSRKHKCDDDHEDGDQPRRARKKAKRSPSSLVGKKRAKMIKKSTLNAINKTLNKDDLSTLNTMHNEIAATHKSNPSFNDSSLTSLKEENLNDKLLKDCKISAKIMKSQMKVEDDVNEAIDVYLKKLKKHFVNYLTYMKESEFEEKIKLKIKQEHRKKSENLKRIEKLEKQTNEILKQDIILLKKRAEELGIECLESPKQLMDYARNMLDTHFKLLEHINSIQKQINSLEIKQPECNGTSHLTKATLLNTSNTRLRNTFDSLEKFSNYFNINQKLDLQNLIKTTTEECLSTPCQNGVRSVESTKSTDETLTATERGDDDLVDDDDSDYDEDTREAHKKSNKSKVKTVQPPPRIKYEKYLDQDTTNQNWRNFKIPKKTQQLTNDDASTSKQAGPHTPPGSPTLSTSSSTSSANSINNHHHHHHNSSSANTEQIKYSSMNDSIHANASSGLNSKQQYSNYYHPKKNQFRQYMMENSTK